MSRAFRLAIAAAALTFSGEAFAWKAVKTKGPVVLDSKLGYVLARIGPVFSKKGASPTIVLYRIDPATSRLRTVDKKSANPIPKGEDAMALIGGSKPFGVVPVTGAETGVFLVSLTPGEWVVVGTESTCFCMGSYRFTVKAGEVADIGAILTAAPAEGATVPEFAGAKVADDLAAKPYTVVDLMTIRKPTTTDAVSASLQSLARRPVEYALTRFDNPGGWMVSRLAGLPPLTHEGVEAAAAVSDPRFPPGTSANRWPDVNDQATAASAKQK